jgi:putative ABC transport system substrate-binding protein
MESRLACMARRDFIAGLAGAVVLPLAARAQQSMPVVGFLRSATLSDVPHIVAGFRQGLKEAGFIEGQNVTVEYRAAESDPGRLKALAAEFARWPAAVIVGDNIAALAAKAVTTTVPIVFTSGGDPVKSGLVASLKRPGGNATGISIFTGELGSKRLELLRQLVPQAATVAVLLNPNTPTSAAERNAVEAAALKTGQRLLIVNAANDRDLEAAFATIAQRKPGALLVGASAFLNSRTTKIVALTTRFALPAIYFQREAAVAGGLMSYGTNLTEAYNQAGIYAGRILKGEKPSDLPAMRATKFEFVVNLKIAKALGLEFHPQLLATADEVIE